MVDVGVDVAVGEQAYKVQYRRVGAHIPDEAPPDLSLKHCAAFDRKVDQPGPLCEYPPAADRIVPHFGIAHVVIAWKADRLPVRLQPGRGAARLQGPEMPHVGRKDRIALSVCAIADTVHNGKHNGPFSPLPLRILLQRFNHR